MVFYCTQMSTIWIYGFSLHKLFIIRVCLCRVWIHFLVPAKHSHWNCCRAKRVVRRDFSLFSSFIDCKLLFYSSTLLERALLLGLFWIACKHVQWAQHYGTMSLRYWRKCGPCLEIRCLQWDRERPLVRVAVGLQRYDCCDSRVARIFSR